MRGRCRWGRDRQRGSPRAIQHYSTSTGIPFGTTGIVQIIMLFSYIFGSTSNVNIIIYSYEYLDNITVITL